MRRHHKGAFALQSNTVKQQRNYYSRPVIARVNRYCHFAIMYACVSVCRPIRTHTGYMYMLLRFSGLGTVVIVRMIMIVLIAIP